jgi:hypothetical protein
MDLRREYYSIYISKDMDDADSKFGRRRTHQSGPLGELFDHGVDAVNTSLECLIFAASQNLGMGWKTVMTLFACKNHPTVPFNHILRVDSSLDILRPDLGRVPH